MLETLMNGIRIRVMRYSNKGIIILLTWEHKNYRLNVFFEEDKQELRFNFVKE